MKNVITNFRFGNLYWRDSTNFKEILNILATNPIIQILELYRYNDDDVIDLEVAAAISNFLK